MLVFSWDVGGWSSTLRLVDASRSNTYHSIPSSILHLFWTSKLTNKLNWWSLPEFWSINSTRCWQVSNIFLFSSRNLGKMNPFWRAYFSNGSVKNHQLEYHFGFNLRKGEVFELEDSWSMRSCLGWKEERFLCRWQCEEVGLVEQ